MPAEDSIDTETLVASLGQVRRWVLPAGMMQELIRRGPEVMPALIAPIEKAMDAVDAGLGSLPDQSFFCFYLLGIDPNPSLRALLDRIFRCDDKRLDLIVGEITETSINALMAAMVDPDDIESHCEWIESLVRDPDVNMYAKLKAVDSLLDLAAQDVVPKETVLSLIQTSLEQRADEKQDELTALLICDLLETKSADFKAIAEAAFERDQVDTMIVGSDSLTELSGNNAWVGVQERAKQGQEILKDPVGFLSEWHAFAWKSTELRSQNATYQRISPPDSFRDPVSKKEIAAALKALETANFEIYPKEAIATLHQNCSQVVPELTQRVRFGIEAAKRGESKSTLAPGISALLLALNVNQRSTLFDDAALFFEILDLPTSELQDWFGEAFDTYLVSALAHMLHGETDPIESRLLDDQRDDVMRANLIHYFPMAVLAGCLSRERCLEVLHDLANKWFKPDSQATSRLVVGAVREALCMMSVPSDSPVMQLANELGITNGLVPDSVTEQLVNEPTEASKILAKEVLPNSDLEKAIEESGQFSNDAIHPPPLDIDKEFPIEILPRSTGNTIRVDGPRVSRNAPCPCGSGKKSKKCCGRASASS